MIPETSEVLETVADWLAVRPAAGYDHLFTIVCGNRTYASRLQLIWVQRGCSRGKPGGA